MSMDNVYHKKIIVKQEHLDKRQHVNNIIYLQWVQDVSEEHWLAKTDGEINSNFFWVVRSHQLEYKRQVFDGDELEVKTYVANYKGPFSVRIVEFYKDDELVVSVKSNWCLIHPMIKHRPGYQKKSRSYFKRSLELYLRSSWGYSSVG